MLYSNCRRCIATILLTIWCVHSARANNYTETISNQNASIANTVNLNNVTNQLNNTNIQNKDVVLNHTDVINRTNNKYVELKLIDLENMVLDYLDENLPPADENVDSDGHVMQRSLGHNSLFNRLRKFAERYIHPDISKAVSSTGRVFLLKGFKKFMWPVFIGMQVAKTVLIAMFLPSIIGSLGKIVGKGLSSVSGYGHQTETVGDFEFKDNAHSADNQNANIMGYNYPVQQDALPTTDNNYANQMYDSAASNNALSLYELGEQKLSYGTNTFNLQEYTNSKRMEGLQSKKDDFKVFHDIPASSLLLTSYDPFYSPLLSRLDSVFHQVHLDAGSEPCREKLVCLMYANPAKYMPYSNLVSAQLSRELNELRKPTSDNVEILRFFRYMKAAKEGQDGNDCHDIYSKCTQFIENDGPAMINTFNDINKLVQARKL